MYVRASEFFSWWKDELLSFVPSRLQNFLKPQQDMVLLVARGSRLILQYYGQINSAVEQEVLLNVRTVRELRTVLHRLLKKFGKNSPIIALDLPSDRLLTLSLLLPAAAAGDFRQAALYEMERRTPFRPEEVYYDARVLRHSEDDTHIKVLLRVVPRELVDDSVRALASLGVRLERIGFAAEGLSAANGFNVLPPRTSRSGARRNTLITVGLGVLVALLLSISVFVSLSNKEKLANNLLHQLSILRTEVVEARQLDSALNEIVQRYRLIQERKRTHPSVVTVLDELTRLMPDDVWLHNMRINNGKVTISGEAQSATALVGLIEDSPRFHNVSMRSQVTRNRKSNKDMFQLSFHFTAKAP